MNVASLDLCRELYELSGWEDTLMWSDLVELDRVGAMERDAPAYDLGYLLRKLPENCILQQLMPEMSSLGKKTAPRWYVRRKVKATVKQYAEADTPEDATCQLLITLIKQKVITV